MTKEIAVLLSVYNGQKFLREQIDSYFTQIGYHNLFNLTVYVRDDGSSDSSAEIIAWEMKQHPNEIVLQKNSGINLGVKNSFHSLVKTVPLGFDLVFFSDQDDVWENNKVYDYLKIPSSNMPLGIYSDLWIADRNAVINDKKMSDVSHWKRNSKNRVMNYTFLSFDYRVTGAAFAINTSALSVIRQIDDETITSINMHDSYYALIISLIGNLVQIDKPLVKYRQHENNVIGALNRNNTLSKKIRSYINISKQLVHDNVSARSFVIKHRLKISQTNINILEDYYQFSIETNWFKKMWKLGKITKYIHLRRKIAYVVSLALT